MSDQERESQPADPSRREVLASAALAAIGLAAPAQAQDLSGFSEGNTWKLFGERLADIDALLQKHSRPYPNDLAAGQRCAARLLQLVLEWLIDGSEPSRPRFFEVSKPARKFLGDNPDQTYRAVSLHSDYNYLLEGSMDGARFVEIGIYSGNLLEDQRMELLAMLDERQLKIGRDGKYVLEVRVPSSTERQHNDNFLAVPPQTGPYNLLLRSYFTDFRTRLAHSMPRITCLNNELDEGFKLEDVPRVLLKAPAMVKASLNWWQDFLRRGHATLAPNRFTVYEERGVARPRSVRYASCYWELRDDQALQVALKAPLRRGYWSLIAYNPWGESGDWPFVPTAINNYHALAGRGGIVRVTLSSKPPNDGSHWLSTDGQRRGTLSLRWARLDEEPLPKIQTRVSNI